MVVRRGGARWASEVTENAAGVAWRSTSRAVIVSAVRDLEKRTRAGGASVPTGEFARAFLRVSNSNLKFRCPVARRRGRDRRQHRSDVSDSDPSGVRADEARCPATVSAFATRRAGPSSPRPRSPNTGGTAIINRAIGRHWSSFCTLQAQADRVATGDTRRKWRSSVGRSVHKLNEWPSPSRAIARQHNGETRSKSWAVLLGRGRGTGSGLALASPARL